MGKVIVNDGGQHAYVNTTGVYQRLSALEAEMLTVPTQVNLDNKAPKAKTDGWKDVKVDFGVKGDGITDDTTAIQNAYNYARDNGSVRLVFPDGTYLISHYIQVYKNTTVIFHSNVVIKRIGTSGSVYNKMFVNGTYGNATYDSSGGYTGDGNIHFYGGTFDLNCQAGSDHPLPSTLTVTFFDLGHAENISFHNITVKNGQSGHYFQVSSCKNVKFKNCWFGGITYTGDGSNFDYECIQIEVATTDSFPDFGSYDLTISRDIYIEDCTFDGVIRAVGTHSDGKYGTANVIFCENIQLRNNVIRNVADNAINFTGYRYSVVENNLIDTVSGYGINMNVSEDNFVSGNKVLNTQKSGLNLISSHNNKFKDNTIKEVALSPTTNYSATRLTTSNGNTFDDNTVTAVTPKYTYAWYSSGGGINNRIISHNYTKGTSAVIGGADDTEKNNIQFGNGQTVLFNGDISVATTPVTLPHDIRNFNYLVILANNNSGTASMQSMMIPKSAIAFGATTSRFRIESADGTTNSNQIDFSFPTATSIQADLIQGTGHIRQVIGMM